MENAGIQVIGKLLNWFPDIKERKCAVFAGKGNNGGDGFVVARHLFNRKINVEVFLLGKQTDFKAEAKVNAAAAKNIGVPIYEIDENFVKANKKEKISCSHLFFIC